MRMNAKAMVAGIVFTLSILPTFSQDAVKARLDKSPRHHEWVEVKAGDRKVHTFVVFPEVKEKATAVVVIHENKGLTDWVRSVADQLAEAGFIAVAPDLLTTSDGKKTSDIKSTDEATKAIYALPPDQVTSDLKAVADYARKIPAGNGKVAVAGFCWGGAQAFRFANNHKDLVASFVFYGTGPENEEGVKNIQCPVYGFYGGNDARVNATIPKSAAAMQKTGKTFEPVIYEGAGHGFMRAGEEENASEANKKARKEGWERWKQLLKHVGRSSGG